MTVTFPAVPAAPTAPTAPTASRRADDAMTDDAFAQALDRARPGEHEPSGDRSGVRARRAGARTDRSEGHDAAARDVETETAEHPESDPERTRPRAATDDSTGATATTPFSAATPVAVGLPRAALDLFQRIVGTAIDAAGATATAGGETAPAELSALVATASPAGAQADAALGDGSAGTIAGSLATPVNGEALPLPDDIDRPATVGTSPRVDAATESPAPALASPAGTAEPSEHAVITPDPRVGADASRVAAAIEDRPIEGAPVEGAPVEVWSVEGSTEGGAEVAAGVAADVAADVAGNTDELAAARASTMNGESVRRAEAPPAAQAANSTSAAASVRQPAAAEQVVNVLAPLRLRGDGNYEVRLELKPPELGRVEIRVEMRDGVLHAHLRAEQPAAAMALRDSLTQLRDHLAGHGVHAGTLDVDTNGAGGRRHGLDLGGDPADAHTDTTRADRSTAERNARSSRPARREDNTTNRLDVHA